MIVEWGTSSGDSWKQRVCEMNYRGTLKTKICVFLFSFLFFPLLFISLKLIIISSVNKLM